MERAVDSPSFGSWVTVVGTSAGGGEALRALLSSVSPHLAAPVVVVRHLSPDAVWSGRCSGTWRSIVSRPRTGMAKAESWGARSQISCPDCGGVMWEQTTGSDWKFRCHTGHVFEALPLLAAQSGEIERTLWTALRMFEERKFLLSGMAARAEHSLSSVGDSIAEAEEISATIRRILHAAAGLPGNRKDDRPWAAGQA